jgi:hypothetical protein
MRLFSFIQSDALTRSLLHIFPTSKGGFSAQPIACSITLFADRPDTQSIGLEGVQLNQPDGVRLDELFPRLKEGGNSLAGLIVELEPSSQRTDLSSSTCSIELVNRDFSIMFSMIPEQYMHTKEREFAIVADAMLSTSLVVVNGSSYAHDVRLSLSLSPSGSHSSADFQGHSSRDHLLSVKAGGVQEFPLSEMPGLAWTTSLNLFGESSVAVGTLGSTEDPAVKVFLLYRNTRSGVITSVIPV